MNYWMHEIDGHWLIHIQVPSSSKIHKTVNIVFDRSHINVLVNTIIKRFIVSFINAESTNTKTINKLSIIHFFK